MSELSYAELESLAINTSSSQYHSSAITSQCLTAVTDRFSIPIPVIRAFLLTESGYPSHIRSNNNLTYDVGPMQINSIHWPRMYKEYDISPISIRFNGCINIFVGAELIRMHFDAVGKENISNMSQYFKIVANYHSKTPSFNKKYQVDWVKNFDAVLRENSNVL